MIGVLGVSHQTAEIRVRELFSFTENLKIQLLETLKSSNNYIKEAFILSTCNRTEIYYRCQHVCVSGSKSLIYKKIQEVLGVEMESCKNYFYSKFDDEACKHLFNVASGLESIAIGEYQIVNQLKDAFKLAQEQKTVGKYFTRMFNKALEISKVVRNKTGISQGATSISYIAIDRCQQVTESLEDKKVLLLGLGQTGELVLKKFIKRNVKDITIANRTIERAKKKAEIYNANYLPFDEALASIVDYDVVVTSTSAGKIILSRNHVENLLVSKDRKRPIVFVDLSVPRNIEDGVGSLSNVTLLNVDDLEAELESNMKQRENMVEIATIHINKGLEEFLQWLSMQNISPLANSIKERLHGIHTEELQSFQKNKSQEEIELIEMYGKHIAEKYSRVFIKNLVDLTQNGKKTDYINIANKIFE